MTGIIDKEHVMLQKMLHPFTDMPGKLQLKQYKAKQTDLYLAPNQLKSGIYVPPSQQKSNMHMKQEPKYQVKTLPPKILKKIIPILTFDDSSSDNSDSECDEQAYEHAYSITQSDEDAVDHLMDILDLFENQLPFNLDQGCLLYTSPSPRDS